MEGRRCACCAIENVCKLDRGFPSPYRRLLCFFPVFVCLFFFFFWLLSDGLNASAVAAAYPFKGFRILVDSNWKLRMCVWEQQTKISSRMSGQCASRAPKYIRETLKGYFQSSRKPLGLTRMAWPPPFIVRIVWMCALCIWRLYCRARAYITCVHDVSCSYFISSSICVPNQPNTHRKVPAELLFSYDRISQPPSRK